MSANLKKMLVMNGASFFVFVYVGIYVNLYIWEKRHLIFDVAWFNMFVFFAWSIAFTTAGYLLSKHSIRLLLGISAAFGGAAFGFLSFVQLDNRMLWIALIGLPVGFMYGFFYASQNLGLSLSGKANEFGYFFAMASSIAQAVSLIVPLLSAQVIVRFGYASSFALVLVFLSFMLIFSFFMPKLTLKDHVNMKEKTYFRRLFKDGLFAPRGMKWLAASNLSAGIAFQFQNLFALIYTFSITENKLLIAGLNSLYTLVALTGLILYRKIKMKDSNWFVVGTALLSSGFVIVLFPTKVTLIISNILTTIGLFYYSTIWNSRQFGLIKRYSQSKQAMYLVWRESLLVVSRIITLLFVLSVKQIEGILFAILVGVTLFFLFSVPLFQYKAERAFQREDELRLQLESVY